MHIRQREKKRVLRVFHTCRKLYNYIPITLLRVMNDDGFGAALYVCILNGIYIMYDKLHTVILLLLHSALSLLDSTIFVFPIFIHIPNTLRHLEKCAIEQRVIILSATITITSFIALSTLSPSLLHAATLRQLRGIFMHNTCRQLCSNAKAITHSRCVNRYIHSSTSHN